MGEGEQLPPVAWHCSGALLLEAIQENSLNREVNLKLPVPDPWASLHSQALQRCIARVANIPGPHSLSRELAP